MVYSNKLVDHGSNHITLWFWLIFYIHVWHGICFPWQSEFETTSSKADVYPRPRLDTWRTALPSGSVRLSISVGILLEFCWNSVGDSDWWFSLILPFPHFPGISMDFRRFPGARQRLAMLSFRTGRKSNKGHCSLNSTETVRLKCEFTNLYEL